MENASKALMMAASVLIALVIIGALLLMFNSISSYQNLDTQNTREAQIIEFNNQYETYDRKDVRGTELISLLNKVISYNRNKSEAATGTDQGKDLKFQAMSITFEIKQEHLSKLKYEGMQNKIFTNTNRKFELNNAISDQIVVEKINTIPNELEEEYGGKNALTTITSDTAMNTLYNPNTSDKDDYRKAVELWNRVITTKPIAEIYNGGEINYERMYSTGIPKYKEDICTYYEYIQFKRLHFDCTKTEYNEQTGRIVKLVFVSNGTIE